MPKKKAIEEFDEPAHPSRKRRMSSPSPGIISTPCALKGPFLAIRNPSLDSEKFGSDKLRGSSLCERRQSRVARGVEAKFLIRFMQATPGCSTNRRLFKGVAFLAQ